MADNDMTQATEVLSEAPAEMTMEQAVAEYLKAQEAHGKTDKPTPRGEDLDAEVIDGQEVPETEVQSQAETPDTPEGESQPEQEETEAPLTLKLDDGTEITADEAVKGYLRTSDYTRKTQALSQKEREAQAQIQSALNSIEGIYKEVQALRPQEPDWLAIKRDYPDQWQDMRLQWELDDKRRSKIASELQTHKQQALRTAQERAFNELIAGEFEPKWRNQQVLNQDIAKLAEWAKNQGFQVERINSVDSSAEVIAWEKARRYDEIMAKVKAGKKVVATKPKPQPPGAKPKQPQGIPKSTLERFDKTRSISDAVAVYSAAQKQFAKGASQRRH